MRPKLLFAAFAFVSVGLSVAWIATLGWVVYSAIVACVGLLNGLT